MSAGKTARNSSVSGHESTSSMPRQHLTETAEIGRCGETRLGPRLPLAHALDEAEKQIRLVGEVVINRAVGNPGLSRYLPDRRPLRPLLREHNGRGVEDLTSTNF